MVMGGELVRGMFWEGGGCRASVLNLGIVTPWEVVWDFSRGHGGFGRKKLI